MSADPEMRYPSVRDVARAAYAAGLCVVPPREDGTKAPLTEGGEWKHWQSTRPTVAQLKLWYSARRSGVGILTGAISQHTCLFEFDRRTTYDVFHDTAEAMGLGELVARIEAGYLEETPGGGIHWLYRCAAGVQTTPLARYDTGELTAHGKPIIKPLIETKGEGGFAVLAPSWGRVHPSGRPYVLLAGGVDSIADITAAEQEALFTLARAFDELPEPEPIEHGGASAQAGKRPGDEFNARASWSDVLEPHGWVAVYQQGGKVAWRRPGKQDGISATTNYGGSDYLYMFTSSTDFQPNQSYSKWRAYAILEHGGDFKAAARALAEQGYGSSALPRPLRLHPDRPRDASALPLEGVTIDDFRAYMPEHKYIFQPSRELWPSASVNARLGRIDIGEDDTISASAWLDKNHPVEQMTWAPGEETLIEGRLISNGGWIHRPGLTCFNLYRPATIERGDAAAAEHWIEHVHYVYPNEAEHIIRWMAHRVQHPGAKINHALVLGGQQGIGKDTLLEPIKYAVGPWNFQEVSPVQLLGRFNGFVKSVILRVSEARDLGDVDRYGFYEHLKVYTASPPDVLRCDEKNLREYSVLNVCGVVITTNHKTDGIYLPADDRRHFVAWSDLTLADFTPAYWNDLYRWYAAGGYGHVAAYLSELDISDFDPKAPPVKTAAFWDIVDASRAPEDAELADALESLGYPPATTIATVSSRAAGDFALWANDRKNRRQIPHRMEAAGYVPVRNDTANDGLWKIDARRQVIYARRELSIRDRIVAAQKLTGR